MSCLFQNKVGIINSQNENMISIFSNNEKITKTLNESFDSYKRIPKNILRKEHCIMLFNKNIDYMPHRYKNNEFYNNNSLVFNFINIKFIPEKFFTSDFIKNKCILNFFNQKGINHNVCGILFDMIEKIPKNKLTLDIYTWLLFGSVQGTQTQPCGSVQGTQTQPCGSVQGTQTQPCGSVQGTHIQPYNKELNKYKENILNLKLYNKSFNNTFCNFNLLEFIPNEIISKIFTNDNLIVLLKECGDIIKYIPKEKLTPEMYIISANNSYYIENVLLIPSIYWNEDVVKRILTKVIPSSSLNPLDNLIHIPKNNMTPNILKWLLSLITDIAKNNNLNYKMNISIVEDIIKYIQSYFPSELIPTEIWIYLITKNSDNFLNIPEKYKTEQLYKCYITSVNDTNKLFENIPEEKRTDNIYNLISTKINDIDCLLKLPKKYWNRNIFLRILKQNYTDNQISDIIKLIPKEMYTYEFITTILDYTIHNIKHIPIEHITNSIVDYIILIIKTKFKTLKLNILQINILNYIPTNLYTDDLILTLINMEKKYFEFIPKKYLPIVYDFIKTKIKNDHLNNYAYVLNVKNMLIPEMYDFLNNEIFNIENISLLNIRIYLDVMPMSYIKSECILKIIKNSIPDCSDYGKHYFPRLILDKINEIKTSDIIKRPTTYLYYQIPKNIIHEKMNQEIINYIVDCIITNNDYIFLELIPEHLITNDIINKLITKTRYFCISDIPEKFRTFDIWVKALNIFIETPEYRLGDECHDIWSSLYTYYIILSKIQKIKLDIKIYDDIFLLIKKVDERYNSWKQSNFTIRRKITRTAYCTCGCGETGKHYVLKENKEYKKESYHIGYSRWYGDFLIIKNNNTYTIEVGQFKLSPYGNCIEQKKNYEYDKYKN